MDVFFLGIRIRFFEPLVKFYDMYHYLMSLKTLSMVKSH